MLLFTENKENKKDKSVLFPPTVTSWNKRLKLELILTVVSPL